MIGRSLAHYRISAAIGAGGMGEVYRATDTRLGREVALKVLPPDVASQPERLERFEREAKALAALDHPGIVTVYSVEEAAGVHFLTMQLVPGGTLDRQIPKHGLPEERVVELGLGMAEALAVAHEKGIVHRDVKPGNVMVADDGRVKVLDFGLAKQTQSAVVGADEETSSRWLTREGLILGTLPYMSPEQVEGRAVGSGSDVFSLGVVLFEMVTGSRPFRGATAAGLVASIVKETPPPLSRLRSEISRGLEGLVARCLDKDAEKRPTAAAVRDELLRLRRSSAREQQRSPFARPGLLATSGLALAAVIAVPAWTAVKRSRDAAFVAQALPRIEQLAREGSYPAAVELARQVERVGGTGAVSAELWGSAANEVSVESQPAGASVEYRRFPTQDPWTDLGTTPLAKVRVPRGPLHWRARKPGRQPADFVTATPGQALRFELRGDADPDREMVHVPGGDFRLWALGTVRAEPTVNLQPFLIDRREVTNREYARFVQAGGYARAEYERFRDLTGRPGPATWRLGSFPDGEDEQPVRGLSWYEAAAYCEFARKELPTIYHWFWADTAGDLQLLPGLVLPTSNYEGKGPRAASGDATGSAFGALDMAGNVREWSASASDGGTRIALGGAWNDPSYQYLFPDLRPPADRAAENGVRCIKRLGSAPLAEAVSRPLAKGTMRGTSLEPAPDPVYRVLTNFFERQEAALEPRIEANDDTPRHWTKQKVSFAAGYGGERVTAYLYLPRSARPPYQVVIQMAGAGTFYRRTSAKDSDIFGWSYAEYLIRGGRAVLLPVWKGSYERSDGFHPLQSKQATYREHVIQWVSELRQSIEYVRSRNDLDGDRIGYQGISFGASWAPLFLALEPRIKTAIVLLGGLLVTDTPARPFPPELEAVNYAPRVKIPVLMMSGRHDAIFPYETSQVPLYRLFGTPAPQKRHLTFPGGHSSFGWSNELNREGLDWLDRQLGPVASR
jgi:formylglycine-generating enzyme required for sulfatase activity/dienelactone hydrolase